MGQLLHGSATTTEAVRRAIQSSQESLRAFALRHEINRNTMRKWRGCSFVADRKTGPKGPCPTVLSLQQEAVIVAFRRHTLLPLDDCLYAPQATITQLRRSSLHRCRLRHSIGRLPEVEGTTPARQVKQLSNRFLPVDVAQLCTMEGKLHQFVTIERTSKARLRPAA